MKKTLVVIIALLLLPAVVHAADADTGLDRPHWSLELKAGDFTPALPNWKQHYGSKEMPEYGLALAYKVERRIEIGAEAGGMQAAGKAYYPQHGIYAGRATYTLYPVDLYVLVRGLISEGQWVVPYIGGGWTRILYREQVEGQDAVTGSADGYNFRGGLQFLLDGLDPDAANNFFQEYGVNHTYLIVEAEKRHAVVSSTSTDLGGTSLLAGLLFEF